MKRNIEEAVKCLRQNGLLVDLGDKVINTNERDIGIKLWGVIDFLCNYQGFRWTRGW